ncbi:MAG: rhodanese-like domain-containing protein [Chlorobiaceae bacterium]|nr:rhodanese-like domain-containing protein [Chlorobiaceae bacterium]
MSVPDLLLEAAIMVVERTHRVESLGTDELASLLSGPERPLLFDTRSAGEYEESHIASALQVDPVCGPDAFEARYGELLGGRDVVFYCSVGHRSSELIERVAPVCRQSGAKRCRNLRGGIFRWYNEGRPVVDATGVTDDIHGYDPVWGMMVARRR